MLLFSRRDDDMTSLETEQLLPSELIAGRRIMRADRDDHAAYWAAYGKAAARHPRSLMHPLSGMQSRPPVNGDQMYPNAVYHRFNYVRPRPSRWLSPACIRRRYRKELLRWRRLLRDRSLSRQARLTIKSLLHGHYGVYASKSKEEAVCAYFESRGAFNSVSGNRRAELREALRAFRERYREDVREESKS